MGEGFCCRRQQNPSPTAGGSHYLLLMRRAQRRYKHCHDTDAKGHIESQVQAAQEEGEGRGELAHTAAIDEHLHHRLHRD